MNINLAGVVPAYQQVLWVHELLVGSPSKRVGIMERAVLLALAAGGEIDVAEGIPVRAMSAADISAWVQFAEDDVWQVCMAMVHRGWLLDVPQRGFALRVAYPVIEESPEPDAIEESGEQEEVGMEPPVDTPEM